MEDWTTWTDDQVFGNASESPGSQASYWRDIEIKRRLYLLQREALQGQVDATVAQRAAVAAQQDAITEMRWQSKMMLASVGVALLATIVTLAAAFID